MASPGYFAAMRLRLVDGRLFTRRDGTGAPRVLVVNESFVHEVLCGEPAVGRRVRFAGAGSVSSGGDDVPWGGDRHRGGRHVRRLSATGNPADRAGAPDRRPAAVPFLREAVAETRLVRRWRR